MGILRIGLRPIAHLSRKERGEDGHPGFGLVTDYLTTDWKSGEVRRLANWLSEEE
jgi:hypothetical protein